jgi:hypothetical protein
LGELTGEGEVAVMEFDSDPSSGRRGPKLRTLHDPGGGFP